MVPNWYIVQTICWNVQISRELSIIQTLNQKWTSILFSWETIFKNCKNVKLVPLRGSGERVRIQCTFLDSWTVVCHRHNGQSPSRGKFLATQICRSFFLFHIFPHPVQSLSRLSAFIFPFFSLYYSQARLIFCRLPLSFCHSITSQWAIWVIYTNIWNIEKKESFVFFYE